MGWYRSWYGIATVSAYLAPRKSAESGPSVSSDQRPPPLEASGRRERCLYNDINLQDPPSQLVGPSLTDKMEDARY